jgi:hypothetical protein
MVPIKPVDNNQALQAAVTQQLELMNGIIANRVKGELNHLSPEDPRWLLVESAMHGDLNRDGKLSRMERF